MSRRPGRRDALRASAALGLLPVLGLPQTARANESSKEKSMESAKRRAPKVKPLTHQGVRYEPLRRARDSGFSQSGGVLTAVDVASGNTLWSRQLYETAFDANEERDVQEVYITTIEYEATAKALLVTDERRRRWRVQLSDGKAEALPAAAAKR